MALARYRLSLEVECTAGCFDGYSLLITAGLLPWIVPQMVLMWMACDMVLEIGDDTKLLIPWFTSTLPQRPIVCVISIK